ncbi:tripartite tricarboxylate transporter TctB family protein [Nitratireductor sp. GCM10026969]|uniref:tripartite tricarboxylate transporter TctB family protein n=1 Tax=Nitratireductor sp. GCM10026969 TaxID=3252645 RepID=UPI00360AB9E6
MSGTDSRKSDVVIGLIVLAFCGFAAWRTLYVSAAPSGTAAGPAFVPWLVIGLIALLAVALMARAVLRYRTGNPEEPIVFPGRGTVFRMGLFAVLMVAYAAAFMRVGYIPSTLAAFVAGLLLFGERRLWVLVVLPAFITVAVYYGFTELLNVWLP